MKKHLQPLGDLGTAAEVYVATDKKCESLVLRERNPKCICKPAVDALKDAALDYARRCGYRLPREEQLRSKKESSE